MKTKLGMLVGAVVLLVVSLWMSGPWCDELTLVDSSVNFLRTGSWSSNVWYCVYSPLFPIAAASGLSVFGASHLTTVATCLLFALLSACALVDVCRRRGYSLTRFSDFVLAVLFWTGGTFAGIAMNGRPETATLLFTILLADALAPGGHLSHPRLRTFVWAFLLVLTSSYMLPILFVFGCTLLAFNGGDERREVFRRGLLAACGITLAYLVIVVFYASQRELVRFLGFMACFNSVTGIRSGSLPERILAAYRVAPESLALVVLAAVSRRHLKETLFVALIPMLMVLGGRYVSYYSWAFYVASVVLFVRAIPSLPKGLVLAVALVSLGLFGYRTMVRLPWLGERLESARQATAFVDRHRDLLRSGPVVVAVDTVGDTVFYYPLLAIRADMWYRGVETLEAPTDREKFDVGLSGFISDPQKRRELLDKASAIQKYQETFPRKGLLLGHDRADLEKVIARLASEDYRVEEIVVEDPYSIYRIEVK